METIAADLRTMERTPLTPEHVALLRAHGDEVSFDEGSFIAREGDVLSHFYYVLEGRIELVNHEGEPWGDATLGATQFAGEIGFLRESKLLLGLRAAEATRCLAVPRDTMRRLMAQNPTLSDIVVTVFTARHRKLLEYGVSTLTIIGAEQDPNIQRIAAFATRNRIPHRLVELADTAAVDGLEATCTIPTERPSVLYGSDVVIEAPTPQRVAEVLGVDFEPEPGSIFDVVIVGGGPAGVAAAVYAGSEGLSALVVEDLAIGGQAGTSSRIENYMGFPTGISGGDLCWRGEVQAMKFGTRFATPRRAVRLDQRDDGTFRVELNNGDAMCARAVVVATGVQYRRLPIDRLEHFEGAGVYYAATDLEARFCRQSNAVVVGGGNSAGQAAMYLARTADHVHVLVRGESLAASMSSYLSERLLAHPRITIHFRHELVELVGEERLSAVHVAQRETGDRIEIPARAAFVMIGAAPNTGWLSECVELDEKGFVRTGDAVGGRSPYETSRHGVFAVGDVRAGSTKRVASAVGEGSVVMSAVWYHVNDR